MGYDGIIASSNGKILQAACDAHARRKIFDSQAYPQERDQAGQIDYEELLPWRSAENTRIGYVVVGFERMSREPTLVAVAGRNGSWLTIRHEGVLCG